MHFCQKPASCLLTYRGVTREGQGEQNSPGAESLRGAPKSTDKVTGTFFNRVQLLPKDLRFDHGGAKLASCPGSI